MHPNFADKSLWEIVPNVPVLDEHRLVDQGREIHVDAARLQRIAENTNRRFARTGDAVALIVGHTDDEPGSQERPVVGWAKDLRVGPFVDGKKAIYADFYYRKSKANVVGDYPRRSVELWLGKDEIDPIALLGGTTPERDLGVVLKYSRAGQAVRVYRRLFPERAVAKKRVTPKGQVRYELDDLEDRAGEGHEPPPIDDSPDEAADEGQDAAQFKAMLLKLLPEILPEVLAQMGVGDDAGPGGDMGLGGPGMDDGMGMGGPGECPGPGCPGCPGCQGDMAGGDMGAGLPPGGGDPDGEPEMDSRAAMGGRPVKFDAMPSGTNGYVPSDQESDRMVSMSRDGRRSSQPRRPARAAEDDTPVTRVQYSRLLDRLGQSEAEKAVAVLEAEGVDFGSPEDKQAEIGLLARLSRLDAEGGTDHFSGQVEKCRRLYKRKNSADQDAGTQPAYLRYGRQPDRGADPLTTAHATVGEVVKFQRQLTRQYGRHVGWAEAKAEYEKSKAATTQAVTQTR